MSPSDTSPRYKFGQPELGMRLVWAPGLAHRLDVVSCGKIWNDGRDPRIKPTGSERRQAPPLVIAPDGVSSQSLYIMKLPHKGYMYTFMISGPRTAFSTASYIVSSDSHTSSKYAVRTNSSRSKGGSGLLKSAIESPFNPLCLVEWSSVTAPSSRPAVDG
jgi:hypothetical protein